MLHPYHTIRTSGGHVLLIRRRVSNNLPYIRGRLHFTVSATVKKISSTTIDKASINHQKPYTDEELREFTSEYYIPSALHPVVPAASASIADFPVGKVGCYTEKLDALRRWREMFFWVDDALVPWDFAFYTQGSLPRDERPPPGSYSMEDAELIYEEPAWRACPALSTSHISSGTLIQTQHQVHETRSQMQQAEMAELRETDRKRKGQMVEILRVMRDMRREMGDMQAELLALRGQQRARQPGPDARVPDHQDASRDADSHI
ncbi:hypothetical protein Tco_0705558 [Tanacetum coccineum]|uniref:PH domain-containing protein n=1 Tax=Tanacetum coccineum TaxID=301880 RepID=A0ABQ4Y6Z2_9ASTR